MGRYVCKHFRLLVQGQEPVDADHEAGVPDLKTVLKRKCNRDLRKRLFIERLQVLECILMQIIFAHVCFC